MGDHRNLRWCLGHSRMAGAPMTAVEAARFVESSRWQFAKTMPEFPHEYTLKAWCDPEEFEAFARHIQTTGAFVKKTFWRRIYLDMAPRYYWYMSSPEEATLINRAKTEDDEAILRPPSTDALY